MSWKSQYLELKADMERIQAQYYKALKEIQRLNKAKEAGK